MNFEPQKFFIGLIDFFSVWLPGALLVYLLKDEVGQLAWCRDLGLDGTEAWIVFLFASYVAGQFAFLLGSLFDDWFYDPLREGTTDGQIRRLAQGKPLSSPVARWIGSHLFNNDDKSQRQVLRLKEEHLNAPGASSAVNAFQWCKAKLALEHPEVVAEVQRFEADSKFFRSLCAVLLLLFLWEVAKAAALLVAPCSGLAWLADRDPGRLLGLLVMAPLLFVPSFWRYAERRGKSIEQAYWFVIAASYAQPTRERVPPVQPEGLTHAGGVVLCRDPEEGVQYLRVRPKDGGPDWVLPKGHIEPWESPAEAAVREVLEESGQWARVHDRLTDRTFDLEGERVRCAFYMMEHVGSGQRDRAKRHSWLPKPRPSNTDPRKYEWCPLTDNGALPPESRQAVDEVRCAVEGDQAAKTPAAEEAKPEQGG